MKSTVSTQSCNKGLPYPKLMQLKTRNPLIIVLFQEPKRGVCIVGENAGQFDTSWLDEQYWEDFTGSVCLENGDAE